MSPARPAGPLEFFLDFADAEGAVCERAADSTLVLLPATLQADLDLPEEVTVTSEPEVAREDGAVLLVHGHPVLDRAASTVLTRGDAGYAHLTWPASRPPSLADLIERAREGLQVDHGRIDAAGPPPVETYLPALRVGVLVTYATSLEDRFQEREEVWLDATSHLELEPSLRGRLLGQYLEPGLDPRRPLAEHDLAAAVAAADALVARRALSRRQDLAGQARGQREQELARAAAYYDATLASIASRQAAATPERREILSAQAAVTAVERDRRLAEIEERFEPSHEVRPYRLHVVGVPALRVPVHVQRGRRTFPVDLTWILGGGGFAPMRCPHCGQAGVMVAGRERLGCRACIAPPVTMVPPVPVTREVRAQEAPAPKEHLAPHTPGKGAKPRPASPPSRVRPHAGAPGSARRQAPPQRSACGDTERLTRMGDKLAGAFWTAAAVGDRWRGKVTVPHSPMAVLTRLYGPAGPFRAIGVPIDARPYDLTVGDHQIAASGAHTVWGLILTDSGDFLYALRWEPYQGIARVGEVLPQRSPAGRLAPKGALSARVERALMAPSPPRTPPEGAAATVWAEALRRHGLSYALRCLAMWWRLEDLGGGAGPFDEAALGAAVLSLVQTRAGLDPRGPEQAELWGPDPALLASASAHVTSLLGRSQDRPW